MDLAPIVLITYNRPWHTSQTVMALKHNDLAGTSELFVFSDGPKDDKQCENVQHVREYIRTIDGFRKVTVVERLGNLGLAASIIDGVTQVVNEHGRCVVLEDDIVTSPYFLTYMNQALEIYSDEPKVMSVNGYMFPIQVELPDTFFIYGGTSTWGWGTWNRAWAKFNPNANELLQQIQKSKELIHTFNYGGTYNYLNMLRENAAGKNDSWGIRWYSSVFLESGFGLWPKHSLVDNIGFDTTGRNCGITEAFRIQQLANHISVNKIPIEECPEGRRAIIDFYKCFNSSNLGLRNQVRRQLTFNISQMLRKMVGCSIS